MRRTVIAAFACLSSALAHAEGFVRHDLTEIASEARAALDDSFAMTSHVRRLTLTCPGCKGAPTIDLSIGGHMDDAVARLQSGRTSLASLRSACRSRNPACNITELSVGPAVGWVVTHPAGPLTTSATAFVLRGSDLLTIRSLAEDGATAERNAHTLVQALAPRIVGR